jgi:hypothetical protein
VTPTPHSPAPTAAAAHAQPRPTAEPAFAAPAPVAHTNGGHAARSSTKHAPAQKQTPKAASVREPTVPFNRLEEDFFRTGHELANQPPEVDTFDDLEPIEQTGPKRRWFSFGGAKFDGEERKSPKKR